MNFYTINTKGQGYFLTLVLGPSDVVVLKYSQKPPSDQNHIAYKASIGLGNQSLFMGSGSHNHGGRHAHIYLKKDLKSFLPGTERPMTLKLMKSQ